MSTTEFQILRLQEQIDELMNRLHTQANQITVLNLKVGLLEAADQIAQAAAHVSGMRMIRGGKDGAA